jgi:hypothetical protein
LPRLVQLEGALEGRDDDVLVVAVDHGKRPPGLRLVHLGDGLARKLGVLPGEEAPPEASDFSGSLGAAYRRALDSRAPAYEAVQFDLGTGPVQRFERLILPTSLDGRTVNHLLGVTLFEGDFGSGE